MDEAIAVARQPLNDYLKSLVDAASSWVDGTSSSDYAGYDKIIAGLKQETFESQIETGAAWIGTPAQIRDAIADYSQQVGGFEIASMQVNFNTISVEDAEASIALFAREVIPHFK